jgi:hypothetical protein
MMCVINWRKMSDFQPVHDQCCLTQMKHGLIEGVYDAEENVFRGYYWNDLEWTADLWVPVEEVQP